MQSFIFYSLFTMQILLFIYLWIPQQYKKESIKEIIRKQDSKNIVRLLQILCLFIFLFILVLNTLDSLPIQNNFYINDYRSNLKKYFLFYFGMNSIVTSCILLLKPLKTIYLLVNNSVYEKLLVCLLTTLNVSLSKLWYREEIILFYTIILGMELVLFVKSLRKEIKYLKNFEYIFLLFLHLSMTLYCSYILFAQIRMLLV